MHIPCIAFEFSGPTFSRYSISDVVVSQCVCRWIIDSITNGDPLWMSMFFASFLYIANVIRDLINAKADYLALISAKNNKTTVLVAIYEKVLIRIKTLNQVFV